MPGRNWIRAADTGITKFTRRGSISALCFGLSFTNHLTTVLPPTAGFIGKFHLFGEVMNRHHFWLAIAGFSRL